MEWTLNYWQWWVIAGALMCAEMLLPGAFMLWIGLAAAALGLVTFFMPNLDMWVQLLLFAIISLASIMIARALLREQLSSKAYGHLNQRSLQYVGQTFVVSRAITNGRGKIRIGDTEWLVEGPDCAIGTPVRVVKAEGTILTVEKVRSAGNPKT